ncbi:hypothetical protein D3C72_2378400 [compost metagenome]
MAGANPPSIVTAVLYDRDMPEDRTAVGKTSDSAAGATPTYMATIRQNSDCTTISVVWVCDTFSHIISGYTAISSSSAAARSTVRRP